MNFRRSAVWSLYAFHKDWITFEDAGGALKDEVDFGAMSGICDVYSGRCGGYFRSFQIWGRDFPAARKKLDTSALQFYRIVTSNFGIYHSDRSTMSSRLIASTSSRISRFSSAKRHAIIPRFSRNVHARRALAYPVEEGLGDFLPPPALKSLAVDYQDGLLQRLTDEVRGMSYARVAKLPRVCIHGYLSRNGGRTPKCRANRD